MRPDASKKLAAAAPKKGPNPVIIGAVVAAILIVGVVAAILVGNANKSVGSAAGSAIPVGVTGGKGAGLPVDAAAAKSNAPTLDLYEDFQCPNCAILEKDVGAQIATMAKAGEIKLVMHVLSFMDDNFPGSNSSSVRAANAAFCAADIGKFLEYHSAVYAAIPAQEGEGYTDAQLADFAKTSGITGAALTTWQKCATSGQHNTYVADVQEASSRANVTGTPTVKLNDKDVTQDVRTPEGLIAAVKSATK